MIRDVIICYFDANIKVIMCSNEVKCVAFDVRRLGDILSSALTADNDIRPVISISPLPR